MDFKRIGHLTRKQLVERLTDPLSCLQLISTDEHMALPPKYIGKTADGIRDQLDAKLKLYSERVAGVPVAYKSIRLKQNEGWLLEDQPFIHFDVEVEYVVFKPTVGQPVRAIVNRSTTADHVGGVVLGLFNISVPLRHRHREYAEGDEIICKVTDIHISSDILSMSGKFTKTVGS